MVGLSGIPKRFIDGLDKSDALLALANKLVDEILNGNVNQVGTSEDVVACLQNNMISDLVVA